MKTTKIFVYGVEDDTFGAPEATRVKARAQMALRNVREHVGTSLRVEVLKMVDDGVVLLVDYDPMHITRAGLISAITLQRQLQAR